MKNILRYVSVASLLIVVSCSEQLDHQPQPVIASESAMMRFTSSDEFETTTNKIVAMTEQEVDEWEKSKSFVSYRTILKKATEEWQLVDSEEARVAFREKYQDIIKIEDDELIPLIPVSLYQSIANREGTYETEGFVHKVSGDFIITVAKKEYQKLKGITLPDANSRAIAEKGVSIVRYAGEGKDLESARTNAACTPNMVASYFHNESNCRHDRRVFISAKSYLSLYRNYEGDWWQPRVETKVYGHVRTSTFCKWEMQMTILHWKNVSYDINGWSFANNVATPAAFSVALADYTSRVDEFNHTDDRAIGARVLNHNISPAAFTRLHAEGSSRGVAGAWAVIDCQ